MSLGNQCAEDIKQIIAIIDDELEALNDDDPQKDDVLLKFMAVLRALKDVDSAMPYLGIRRASRAECHSVNVAYELESESQEILSFHFFESFGIRVTVLVNFSKKLGTAISARRTDEATHDTEVCLRNAIGRTQPTPRDE